jgi:hypothetical protein
MLQHGFANRLADANPRVQRTVGILKHQLDFRRSACISCEGGRRAPDRGISRYRRSSRTAPVACGPRSFSRCRIRPPGRKWSPADAKADAVHRPQLPGLLAKQPSRSGKCFLILRLQ